MTFTSEMVIHWLTQIQGRNLDQLKKKKVNTAYLHACKIEKEQCAVAS